MTITVEYLSDYPEHTFPISLAFYKKRKPFIPQMRIERVARGFRHSRNKIELPLTLIALDGKKLYGFAYITPTDDLPGFSHLKPWLSFYIFPKYRGQGIGTSFLDAVCETARELNRHRLYLWTANHADWFQKRGWQETAQIGLAGRSVSVLEYRLTAL